MFTVVIPTYNSSSTIEKCLESVFLQGQNLIAQVIIVDDFSSDYEELCQVVSNYKDKLNILVLRNAENRNGSYSRNVGIKNANSKYIAFLDSDDIWLRGHLEKYLREIQTSTSCLRSIYYSPFILCDNDGNERDVRPYRSINQGELVSEYVFFHGQHMQTSTFVVDIETAQTVLFDEQLTRHQDSDFMMRAQELGVNIVFIPNATSRYVFSPNDLSRRVSSGRISSTWCEKFLQSRVRFFNDYSKSGYLINVTCRILYIERKYFSVIYTLFFVGKNIGFTHLFKYLYSKLITRIN